MEKYLKLFLYVLALILIFYGISTMLRSCGQNNASDSSLANGTTQVDSSEDLFEDTDDMSFEANEAQDEIRYDEIDKALDANENTSSSDNQKSTTVMPSDETDSFEMTEAEKRAQKKVESTPTARNKISNDSSSSTNTSSSGSSSGNYLVLTGSYLVKSNAQNMVRKLNDLGYSQSEIVVFDNSQYNSVIASRYRDYGSAVDACSSLKRRGIDCYVHTKK